MNEWTDKLTTAGSVTDGNTLWLVASDLSNPPSLDKLVNFCATDVVGRGRLRSLSLFILSHINRLQQYTRA